MINADAHDEVYLLLKRNEAKFKIGVSRNVSQRVNQVSDAKEIDFENSYLIRLENNQAYKLEKILHYTFEHKKCDGDKSNGNTEWFDKNCLQDVVLFIHEMMERKPKGFIEIKKGVKYIEKKKKTKKLFDPAAELQSAREKIRCMRVFLKRHRKIIVGRGMDKYGQDCFFVSKIMERYDPVLPLMFSIFSLWFKGSAGEEGGARFIDWVSYNEKGLQVSIADRRPFFMRFGPELKDDLDFLWQDIENIKGGVKEMKVDWSRNRGLSSIFD